jgi:thioredoxin-related protein
MKSLPRLLAATFATLLLGAAAPAAEWTDNYAAAVAQAKKEHKVLLLDFEGSDWCVPCQLLEKEVLSTPKFKDYADKRLVLVRVDFPAKKELPDKVKIQNLELRDKYSINMFPTLIVLSADEAVLHQQSGYGPDVTADSLIAQFPK